jgi:hypothetical protein
MCKWSNVDANEQRRRCHFVRKKSLKEIIFENALGPGLPDFSCYNIPKWGKIYQICNQEICIPNVHKIWQMAVNIPSVHKLYQHLLLQDPPKFTQIWIFGLKIYHLATLLRTRSFSTRVRTLRPGVDVMITIFCDFRKKIGVFNKNQCNDQFFA